MRYTDAEALLRLKGERLPSTDRCDTLRTRIWLETIFREHQLSRDGVAKLLPLGDGEPSGIVLQWLKGKHAAKPSRAARLAKILPGSDFVYNLPLFDLLRNKPVRKSQFDQWVSHYQNPDDRIPLWRFPQPEQSQPSRFPVPPCLLFDSNALFERGDVYGLIGILYLVRKAEVENDAEAHLDYLKDAYRALPGACRHRAFRRHWREFYNCLLAIHARVPTSLLLLRPEPNVIEAQVTAKTHVTRRILRPRDPLTHRFTELELPFVQASL